jgi:hypothetical protein
MRIGRECAVTKAMGTEHREVECMDELACQVHVHVHVHVIVGVRVRCHRRAGTPI